MHFSPLTRLPQSAHSTEQTESLPSWLPLATHACSETKHHQHVKRTLTKLRPVISYKDLYTYIQICSNWLVKQFLPKALLGVKWLPFFLSLIFYSDLFTCRHSILTFSSSSCRTQTVRDPGSGHPPPPCHSGHQSLHLNRKYQTH